MPLWLWAACGYGGAPATADHLHWLLVNFLLLLMAYFGAVSLWQGRRIYMRLSAEPFERPPSQRSLALYGFDVFMANLTGWLVYPLFTKTVKPDLNPFWQLLFDYGHEHLGWYALALSLALSGACCWAGPVLWEDPLHRRLGGAVARMVGFMLIFTTGSGLCTFLTKRLVGI